MPRSYTSSVSVLMNVEGTLNVHQLFHPSASSGSASIFDFDENHEYLLIAHCNTISTIHSTSIEATGFTLSVGGIIGACIEIRNRKSILVIHGHRGKYRFDIISDPPSLRSVFQSKSCLPVSAGQRIRDIVISNESQGVVVAQIYEGAVHVFHDLNSNEPRCEMFTMTKFQPVEPVRSVSLLPRSQGMFIVLMVQGLDDLNTTLHAFELKVSGENVIFEKPINLPPTLVAVSKDIRPYRLCYDSSSSSVLFVGGDSTKYSSLLCLSVSEIFGSKTSDHIHAQPLPAVKLVALEGRYSFAMATSFGELYMLDSKKMRLSLLTDLLYSTISGAYTLSFLNESDRIFVGSRESDSILISLEDKQRSLVVTNTAPIIGMVELDEISQIITAVTGVGSSTSLNRMKTSGIPIDIIPCSNSPITAEGIQITGSNLVATWKTFSCCLTTQLTGADSLCLNDTGSSLPADLINVYEVDNKMLCINRRGVFVAAQSAKPVETWKCPPNSFVSGCDYCFRDNILVIATSDKLFRLSKSGTHEVRIPSEHAEISAVAISETVIAVGDWSGNVRLIDASDKVIYEFPVSDHIPRSVWIGHLSGFTGKSCLVGYDDGSVACSVLDRRWTLNTSKLQVGTVPVTGFYCSPSRLFVAGDRPSVLRMWNGKLEAIELVNRLSGTVVPMQALAAVDDTTIMYLGQTGQLQCLNIGWESQCHVQRHFINESDPSSFPVSVEILDNLSLIAVGVSHIGESPTPQDYVGFYDIFSLEERSRYEPQRDCAFHITSMAKVSNKRIVIGTCDFEGSDMDGSISVLVQDAREVWTELTRTVVLCNSGDSAGAVIGLSCVGSKFIVAACQNRSLCVFQLSMHESHFEYCASIETDVIPLCISTWCTDISKIEIAVGDSNKSVSLFSFIPEEGQQGLSRVARDLVPACALAVSLIDATSMLMGDDLGNVYYLRMEEPSFARLERLSGCNIAESPITCIKRAGNQACLVSTREGGICLISWGEGGKLIRPESTKRMKTMIGPVFEPHRISVPSVSHTIPETI